MPELAGFTSGSGCASLHSYPTSCWPAWALPEGTKKNIQSINSKIHSDMIIEISHQNAELRIIQKCENFSFVQNKVFVLYCMSWDLMYIWYDMPGNAHDLLHWHQSFVLGKANCDHHKKQTEKSVYIYWFLFFIFYDLQLQFKGIHCWNQMEPNASWIRNNLHFFYQCHSHQNYLLGTFTTCTCFNYSRYVMHGEILQIMFITSTSRSSEIFCVFGCVIHVSFESLKFCLKRK